MPEELTIVLKTISNNPSTAKAAQTAMTTPCNVAFASLRVCDGIPALAGRCVS
jgi:hypothetical protein